MRPRMNETKAAQHTVILVICIIITPYLCFFIITDHFLK